MSANRQLLHRFPEAMNSRIFVRCTKHQGCFKIPALLIAVVTRLNVERQLRLHDEINRPRSRSVNTSPVHSCRLPITIQPKANHAN